MTPHQQTRLANLTSRGNLAFTREENLRKLACECLELALCIEHHFEGKRDLFDVALEGADVAVMLHREHPSGAFVAWHMEPDKNLRKVGRIAAFCAWVIGEHLDSESCEKDLSGCLARLRNAVVYLSSHAGEKDWVHALDVKLDKAERYISERESAATSVSLREVVNG